MTEEMAAEIPDALSVFIDTGTTADAVAQAPRGKSNCASSPTISSACASENVEVDALVGLQDMGVVEAIVAAPLDPRLCGQRFASLRELGLVDQ